MDKAEQRQPKRKQYNIKIELSKDSKAKTLAIAEVHTDKNGNIQKIFISLKDRKINLYDFREINKANKQAKKGGTQNERH